MAQHYLSRQEQLGPDMLDDRLGDRLQLREVAQPTARLQHHRQREQMLRLPGMPLCPLQILRRHGEELREFPFRDQSLEPRIRGPLYRRHAAPRTRLQSNPHAAY
jgi:hypothetical protein